MRLLLDENCADRLLVKRLAANHDVATVVTAIGAGASDREVAEHACSSNRALLTRDCDDFRALYHIRSAHPGLVLLYGTTAKPVPITRIAEALDRIAAIYPKLQNLVLVCNEFLA